MTELVLNIYILVTLLLSSTDVDVDKPDEKSIMTYVAQFLKYHPGQKDSDSEDQLIEQVTIFFSAVVFIYSCFLRPPRFCLFVSVRVCINHSQQIRPQKIIYTFMLLIIADQSSFFNFNRGSVSLSCQHLPREYLST